MRRDGMVSYGMGHANLLKWMSLPPLPSQTRTQTPSRCRVASRTACYSTRTKALHTYVVLYILLFDPRENSRMECSNQHSRVLKRLPRRTRSLVDASRLQRQARAAARLGLRRPLRRRRYRLQPPPVLDSRRLHCARRIEWRVQLEPRHDAPRVRFGLPRRVRIAARRHPVIEHHSALPPPRPQPPSRTLEWHAGRPTNLINRIESD